VNHGTCRRCGNAVETEHYETFERMHWVCFHYAYEHVIDADVDVDADCGQVGCPSAPAANHRAQLVSVIRELAADWESGTPADWRHTDLGDYLEAVAGRLEVLEDHQAPDTGAHPWSSWAQVGEALRRAAGARR
jgi:hypothetical protein